METESKTLTVRRSATWAIILAKLSALVLLIILANMGVSWLIDRLEVQIWPQHLEIVDRAVLIADSLDALESIDPRLRDRMHALSLRKDAVDEASLEMTRDLGIELWLFPNREFRIGSR